MRHVDTIPYIHSKSLNYYANGTGRDSYISSSAGGLTKLNIPRQFRDTFYNQLRQNDNSYTPQRCKSRLATKSQKNDFHTKTQDFRSHQSHSVQKIYNKYQRMRNNSLALPKKLALKQIKKENYYSNNKEKSVYI